MWMSMSPHLCKLREFSGKRVVLVEKLAGQMAWGMAWVGSARSEVCVCEDSRNAGFSLEGKHIHAVAGDRHPCYEPGRTASGEGADDLTAGVTGFPISCSHQAIQGNKLTPTVYQVHCGFALKGTHGLGLIGLDRINQGLCQAKAFEQIPYCGV